MRTVAAILACMSALPAVADGRHCQIETVCHNAMPCQPVGFDLRLELEGAQWVMTTVGDGGRLVFDRAYGDRNTALFLEGANGSDHGPAHFLVSLHDQTRLFMSVHNATATPVVETFIGTCEVIG